MKKISKKIVALATMAAFVLTLVPAAAFAAATGDYQTSYYKVVDGDQEVDANETVATAFEINATSGDPATNLENVKVWATDDQGRVTSAATFYSDEDETTALPALGNNVYNVVSANNTDKVYVAFSRGGEYTIHAAVGVYGGEQDVTKLDQLSYYEDAQKITVTSAEKTINHVVLNAVNELNGSASSGNAVLHDGDNAGYDLTDAFLVNGIDTYTITGYAYGANNEGLKNETFNVDVNKSGLNLAEATVTTDNTGKFEISFTMDSAADYKLYVTNDDIEFTVNVYRAEASELDTIENTTSDAKTLLASNDNKYGAEGAQNFADAVQFTLTKDNGEVATLDTAIAAEPAADKDSAKDHSKYLTITSKPDKSKLEADDLELVWSAEKGAYTLKYVGGNAKADLIDGEYTVKVALTSGKSAEATFTLAKFGTVKGLTIDMNTLDKGTVANPTLGADITNEVVLGSKVYGVVKYVDENGIEVKASSATVNVGVNGDAVNGGNTEKNLPAFGFETLANNTDNEDLLGTVITVTAFDTKVGKMVATELTVTDGQSANTLAFDSEQGQANKNNTVKVSIVDEEGNLVKETGDMYAYVADKSNEDANVEVTAAGTNGVTYGKGKLTIFSDKETEVDVVVAVKVGNAVYAKTLTYTVGAGEVNADTSVVMTIGSSDYVVNNDVVAGDAAPYIDSAWRTMVPVRALAETFGATVNFEDNVVTIVDGDTEIVMTIGETTYTVNGDEAEMDTAPVIGSGDRTYVPVRFVAEALGYTVTPLQDANGLTASVVFQK